MPTDVVMPQMGESIAEGTIVRWIKKVGDQVERDEPLFEISTDKVDAEIPSPAAGVISEIRVKEGETVAVNSVVAVIGQRGERRRCRAHRRLPPPAAAIRARRRVRRRSAASAAPRRLPRIRQPPLPAAAAPAAPPPAHGAHAVFRRTRSTSARRRSCERSRRNNNVDISQIQGTGISGRVTKDDILDFIAHRARRTPGFGRGGVAGARATLAHAGSRGTARPGEVQQMSVMRKKIAEHMIASRRTSAHVHSVFEVSFAESRRYGRR